MPQAFQLGEALMRPAVITDPREVILPWPRQLEILLKLLGVVLVAGWLLSALTIRR
ncbi:MAG: hypothetical protein NZ765_09610 [Anaerolineae bacterium]|nr:hypothetical protein [Anaerolineae bacterium]MDW8071869.1 hypothetical protein [Anaerolineae bacterium]